MAQLLPSTPSVDPPKRESRVVRIDDADPATDETFQILSSSTARAILVTLYDEPAPPSEIAETVDSSLQNVHHHLERLRQADLIEGVDTWYSSKGIEMTVYAPTNDPLVIAAGDGTELVEVASAGHAIADD